MQTAARLDFIGLPRLRGCGGSIFFVGKKIGGAAVDCIGEVGLGARLDCGGEGWIGTWLWLVGARVGLGARL